MLFSQIASLTGLYTPSLRLGVTGLSRAGKTVFITALIRNLTAGGRLPFFAAKADGRLIAAATPAPGTGDEFRARLRQRSTPQGHFADSRSAPAERVGGDAHPLYHSASSAATTILRVAATSL